MQVAGILGVPNLVVSNLVVGNFHALFCALCALLHSFALFSVFCTLFCARLRVSASDRVQNDRIWELQSNLLLIWWW